MLCYKCQENIPDYSLVCPRCGAEMSVNARKKYEMGPMDVPPVMPMPMTWFNLLVMFYLFLEAFSFVVSGVEAITGFMQYAMPDSEGIITSFADISGKYRIFDIIYGIMCLGFAAFAIVTRFKLSKFKKRAPLFVILYFSVPVIANFIYTVALLIVAKEPLLSYYTLVFQLIIQGAFVYANHIYFKKRKHLFEN